MAGTAAFAATQIYNEWGSMGLHTAVNNRLLLTISREVAVLFVEFFC
jgi:hypothetical protein